MAWWDRIVSAAKSAVSKAVSAVKTVAETVKKTVSSAVSKVTTAVSKVASTVKATVSSSVKKASSSVKIVSDTVKKTVAKAVADADNKVKDIKGTITEGLIRGTTAILGCPEGYARAEDGTCVPISFWEDKGICPPGYAMAEDGTCVIETYWDVVKKPERTIIETAKEALEKVIEKVKEVDWRDKLLNALKSAMTAKLPWLGLPRFSLVESTYEFITGRELTEDESLRFQLKLLDWIVPLNVLSKLFFGVNLDGKPEEFGTVGDYGELALGLVIIVPAGKIGAVAGKLGIKAGTALGLKGFMRFAVTKIDDAAKLFKILNVDDQMKLIRQLLRTDEGIKIVNKLIGRFALHKTLVKPTISLVNKAIATRIVAGKGFTALLSRVLRPKTILWGLSGMLGVIGSAYGIAFGTEWFAKEGLWELYSFPITDKLRDYRYEPTPEKAERIRKEIDNLKEVLPKAQALVEGIAWLWPPTKDAWLSWANGIKFELEQIEEEFEAIIIPELIVLPEWVFATVRDIIDGDTIDVDLDAVNLETKEKIKLPEYGKTGHARIRIVGINAPEKSPKGEILCSDVEIFNVEKKFTDLSRDRLLPLNDKEVILKIDPDVPLDTHNRILAVVEYNAVDIGLRQIKEGLACGYYREPHKYYSEAEYRAATLAAKDEGIGMWAGLEEVEKEEEKIKIKITSEPKNARLFLDDISLRHNTPSDEVELSDVLHLFTLGKHVISAEKGGLSAMEDINIIKGDNGTIHLVLETAPFPEEPTPEEVAEEELAEEEVAEEVEEEEIVEPVVGAVKAAEIPEEYTSEQEWALREAFGKILVLTEGTAIMSAKEREELISSFNLYTNKQKEVLELLWRDLLFYTEGRKQLSADEYAELYDKYRMGG